MAQVKTVYIVEPIDQGWIIERLMRDVAGELQARGATVRVGPANGYGGEQVIFNSRYLTAMSDAKAQVNSLFITHVDDKLKELQLKASTAQFNSFVCMSAQDADFVAALNGSRAGVVGIDLPARDLKVRPIRVAMFSACYEDGRKNEHWIEEHFADKSAHYKAGFIFCFLGWGWESFCARLAKLDMSYEIHRYSRFTPGEYELYKERLAAMDCLIYLGFDGGAMSVYDGVAAGIRVIAPNASYHRGLGPSVSLFDDQQGFSREVDSLHAQNLGRQSALASRSVTAYASHLLEHWNALLPGDRAVVAVATGEAPDETEALAFIRGHYKNLSASRIRSAMIRYVQSLFLK